jgi:hypothetical protein
VSSDKKFEKEARNKIQGEYLDMLKGIDDPNFFESMFGVRTSPSKAEKAAVKNFITISQKLENVDNTSDATYQ